MTPRVAYSMLMTVPYTALGFGSCCRALKPHALAGHCRSQKSICKRGNVVSSVASNRLSKFIDRPLGVQRLLHRCSHHVWRPVIHKKAVTTIFDKMRESADLRGDDRHTASQRFKYDRRKPFPL